MRSAWEVRESVEVDSPARRVAAELATVDIYIMVRFGNSERGHACDIAGLEADFAADVLRKIQSVLDKETNRGTD